MKVKNSVEFKKFSDKWWKEFLSETNKMTESRIFQDCLSLEESSLLKKEVMNTIRLITKFRTNKYGLGVYESGRRLNTNELTRIYDSPPYDNEDLESWSSRVFGNKKFGLIINAVEKFNFTLSKNIAIKVLPLLERNGYPVGGTGLSLFIGNYDKTPMGVHQDPPGEDVIHFHLGPGEKTIATWPKEVYEDLVNVKGLRKQDLSSLREYSKEYDYKEGDIFFMPQGKYHIGKQNGISAALTFWRYNNSKNQLAARLQNNIFTEFVEPNEDILKSDRSELNQVTGLDETLKTVNIPEAMERLNYKELMIETYKNLKYAMYSHAGFRSTCFQNNPDANLNKDSLIQLEKPFKIYYKESLDKSALDVFVRGEKLNFPNFECVKSFIDQINEGVELKVSQLLMILDKDWDKDIGFFILNSIYINHGISVK